MNEHREQVYRVFVTRNYIECTYMDVFASSKKKAASMARQAAETVFPDVREIAVDNRWQADDPIIVLSPGARGLISASPGEMLELYSGVFIPVDHFQRLQPRKGIPYVPNKGYK